MKKKSEAYIRSDGWVFTEDGMSRLKEGGLKGFNRFKDNTEAKIGKWHRVLKPLDRDAAKVVKGVQGLVERARFVSDAITARGDAKGTMRTMEGKAAEFMRLTLTDDAYAVVEGFDNPTFREFVSDAILRAAKRRA